MKRIRFLRLTSRSKGFFQFVRHIAGAHIHEDEQARRDEQGTYQVGGQSFTPFDAGDTVENLLTFFLSAPR